MSFLSNKFKFETKSTERHIADFVSVKPSASLIMMSENSNNEASIFGAKNFSNIEAFIGISSNGSLKNTIAEFSECNINLYTDTLVRGNLIVDGYIMSKGLDIVLDVDGLNIKTFNDYINVGSNVIVQKYQELQRDYLEVSSNNLTEFINNSYSNLYDIAKTILSCNYLDSSQFNSQTNFVYDETQFNNRFLTQSADNFKEGIFHKYIVDNNYDYDKLIINGDLITSNMIVYQDVRVSSSITATQYFGNGSLIKNIKIGDGSTDYLLEGSNLFYTSDRVENLINQSNVDTSNYIVYIQKSLEDIQSNSLLNSSNLIQVNSQLYDDSRNKYIDVSNYSINNNEFLSGLSEKIFEDGSNIVSRFTCNISEILESNRNLYDLFDNISNEILTNTSNQYSNIFSYMTNISQYANELLSISNIQLSNKFDVISNILTSDIYNTHENFSNNINNSYFIFESNIQINTSNAFDFLDISFNQLSSSIKSANDAHSNIINGKLESSLNLLQKYNQELIYSIDYTSNILHSNILECSSNTSNDIEKNGLSNYIYLHENVVNISKNNNDTSNTIVNNLDLAKNLINSDSSNIIYFASNTSNMMVKNILENFQNANFASDLLLNNLENEIISHIQNLTTDNISEGYSNLYYKNDLFDLYFNQINLDRIHNGTSNRFIKNNIYDSNLSILGTVYASNLFVFNNLNTVNTDVFQCGSSKIKSFNNTNIKISQISDNNTNDIVSFHDINNNAIFSIKNDGKVGIKNNNPVYDFDVNGVANFEYLIGNASEIINININDKETMHIREGSNLYYTTERVGRDIFSSNSIISNYISLVNSELINNSSQIINQSNIIFNTLNKIQTNINIQNYNLSNYTINISNYFIDILQSNSVNVSNYIQNTSNIINISIGDNIKNHSNYIQNTYNSLIDNLKNNELNISNLNLQHIDYVIRLINSSNISGSNFTNSNIIFLNDLVSNYSILSTKNNISNIANTSNVLIQQILNIDIFNSNYATNISNSIISNINVQNSNLINYLSSTSNILINTTIDLVNSLQSSGNISSITDIYDGEEIFHMNFSNIKLINNIDNANFKLFNKGTITSVYPSINTVSTSNINTNFYKQNNRYYFNSSNNVYVYNDNDADSKSILDKLNTDGFLIHFLFRTRYTQNTPIFFIGNQEVSYVNIKVLYGYLYLKLGINENELSLYVDNIILPNMWYVVDIGIYIVNNEITFKVYINRKLQNIELKTTTMFLQSTMIQKTVYNTNLNYAGGQNFMTMCGSSNLFDTFEDNLTYTNGAVFTNTYYSSNSYITTQLSPIITDSAYDYSSFSNLIYSSYNASNFDYQYSMKISSNLMFTSYFNNNDARLIIGNRNIDNFDFVFTELEGNIRLQSGYYIFMLDLQNEVSADLLIGTYDMNNIDEYFNVANYYNSNLLNNPSSTINNISNMVLDNPIYLSEGYYRLYTRMLRKMTNRNNNYFIPKYYYIDTYSGNNYNLNDTNSNLSYISYPSIDNLYKTNNNFLNSLLQINNNNITSTSNIYNYVYYSDGVSAVGLNTKGQLGMNKTSTYKINIIGTVLDINGTTAVRNIIDISASGSYGEDHVLFLDGINGSVYGCGGNSTGQLGLGNNTASFSILQKVKGINGSGFMENIDKIYAGFGRSFFITKNDGCVYATGYNVNGECGFNISTTSNILRQVRGLNGNGNISNITQISCKYNHTLFLQSVSNTTTIFSCGKNTWGKLGIGSTDFTSTGNKLSLQQCITSTNINIANIKKIDTGFDTSFALLNNNSVFTCGYEQYVGKSNPADIGVSKFIQTTTNVSDIAAGKNYILFLKPDTYVISSGENNLGQCGQGSISSTSTPLNPTNVKLNSTTNLSGVSKIYSTENSSFFQLSDGTVLGCGNNANGNLSIGNTTAPTSKAYPLNVCEILSPLTFISNVTMISGTNNNTYFLQNKVSITNVSNYNFNISHSNNSTFFAGNRDISSNYLNIQDFKILSNPIALITDYSVSNILYLGEESSNITYSTKIYTNRWNESVDYQNKLRRYIYYDQGNVGIGNIKPASASLEINTGITTKFDNTITNSIRTNNSIWTNLGIITSSDSRIKKNIRDIDDDKALQQILSINPKSYNYIDNSQKDVYGFVAQEVADIIPNAISLHTEVIPNINRYCKMDNDIITIECDVKLLQVNTEIVLIEDDIRYTEKIIEVLDDKDNSGFVKIRIGNVNNIHNSNIYVYGTIVKDFHTIDKSYIYTLNVCALQEIYKRHKKLSNDVEILRNYENIIPMKLVDMSSNISIQQRELSEISFKKGSQENLLSEIEVLKNMTKILVENIKSYNIADFKDINDIFLNLQIENENLKRENADLLVDYAIINENIKDSTNELLTIKSILQMNNIK